MLWNTLLLALRAIRRNLMRSILTMLGVVIGVAAVVTMVTLGQGASASVANQITSLGSNLLMVRPGQRMGPGAQSGAPFKMADVDAIASQVNGVDQVAPSVGKSVTLVVAARNWASSVTGTTNEYFDIASWTLADGRLFTEAELRAGKSVCVIGDRVRRELFNGNGPAVGAQMRVKDFSCDVVGVLQAKGQGAMGNDQDDFVAMPVRTVQRRLTGSTDVNGIMVSARADTTTEQVNERLTTLLRERRKIAPGAADDFNVLDPIEALRHE